MQGQGSSRKFNMFVYFSTFEFVYVCNMYLYICILVYMVYLCGRTGALAAMSRPGQQQQPSEMKSATASRGLHHQQNTLAFKNGVNVFFRKDQKSSLNF